VKRLEWLKAFAKGVASLDGLRSYINTGRITLGLGGKRFIGSSKAAAQRADQ
jgi:hypothetical protein